MVPVVAVQVTVLVVPLVTVGVKAWVPPLMRVAVAGDRVTLGEVAVPANSQMPRPQVATLMTELSGATQISVTRPWGRPVPKRLQEVPPLVVR